MSDLTKLEAFIMSCLFDMLCTFYVFDVFMSDVNPSSLLICLWQVSHRLITMNHCFSNLSLTFDLLILIMLMTTIDSSLYYILKWFSTPPLTDSLVCLNIIYNLLIKWHKVTTVHYEGGTYGEMEPSDWLNGGGPYWWRRALPAALSNNVSRPYCSDYCSHYKS